MPASDYEAPLYRKVLDALARWLRKVRDAVLGTGGQPDASAVLSRRPAWNKEVDKLMPEIEAIAAAGWTYASEQAYVSTSSFIISDMARAENFLRNISNEVYALVVAEMVEGQTAGESVEQLRERIDRVLSMTASPRWTNRARVIAQTECLHGDALVTSANVVAAYRRRYEGPWIEIVTESGNQLSGTPNHPVLTRRGWVGLGDLTEGDHLVCDGIQLQDAVASGDPHVEACPSTIAQVFDALAAVRVLGGVRTGEPDFHGDGSNGYVDVALPDSPLRVGIFSPVEQGRVQGVLEGADLRQVLLACERVVGGPGVCACELRGLTQVAHGVTGRLHDARHRVARAADIVSHALRTLALEVSGNDRVAVEILAKAGVPLPSVAGSVACGTALADRYAVALEVRHDGIDSVAGESANGGNAQAMPVKLDQVRSIGRVEFSGHVYNLTTVEGYFTYRGVYTGNTTRAWNAGVFGSALYYEPVTGPGWTKIWNTVMDGREREAHEHADGQAVGLRDYFQVGSPPVPMLYPGDPRAPASLVINCRCSLDLRRAA